MRRPPPKAHTRKPNKPTTRSSLAANKSKRSSSHAPSRRNSKTGERRGEDSAAFSSETFAELDIDERLKAALERAQFVTLTKIQRAALPVIAQGTDVLIKSTGSGNTLAYAVPLLSSILEQDTTRADGTLCLVIVPTRELCTQVTGIFSKLTKLLSFIVVGSVMGGANKQSEKSQLRKGVTVLIATPGRLLDHLQNTQNFACPNLKSFVLDEADRVIEMGYGEDVKNILEMLSERCSLENVQKILISATLAEDVKALADASLRSPVFVDSDDNEGEGDEDDWQEHEHHLVQSLDIPHKKFVETNLTCNHTYTIFSRRVFNRHLATLETDSEPTQDEGK